MSFIRIAPTRTDKVPNTSATAASSGADLNGAATRIACDEIRGRLAEVAAKHFGIDLQVYMVKVSYDQKPYRRLMMNTWGAECIASPSTLTASGRAALERDPNCSGSLGLAISEAIEVALQHPEDTRYCLGSVLNHVILHQTVIGQEAIEQLKEEGLW